MGLQRVRHDWVTFTSRSAYPAASFWPLFYNPLSSSSCYLWTLVHWYLFLYLSLCFTLLSLPHWDAILYSKMDTLKSQSDKFSYMPALHACPIPQSCQTLQSCELQPARLLCPWDSPGKNPGVVAISSSRRSSRPRDQPRVSCVVFVSGRFFTAEPVGSPACALNQALTKHHRVWSTSRYRNLPSPPESALCPWQSASSALADHQPAFCRCSFVCSRTLWQGIYSFVWLLQHTVLEIPPCTLKKIPNILSFHRDIYNKSWKQWQDIFSFIMGLPIGGSVFFPHTSGGNIIRVSKCSETWTSHPRGSSFSSELGVVSDLLTF